VNLVVLGKCQKEGYGKLRQSLKIPGSDFKDISCKRLLKPLQAAPKYAALFKNGVGLVMSEIDGIDQPGQYNITPLPSATFGSLWFSWGDGIQFDNIIATQAETIEKIPASSIPAFLNS